MEILYNFAVYGDFMQLQPYTPAFGFVGEGEFKYFLYQEACSNCSIIVSLSSYSSGSNLDLYVNKGMRLPTHSSFDLHHQTLSSEILVLNMTTTTFLKEQKVDCMADYWVFGVYGRKNTTFQLSVASATKPVL